MSRCFITQQVPSHLVTKFRISQAGVNFCNNLVKTGVFDQAFAFPVISVKPDIRNEIMDNDIFDYIQFRKLPHKNIGKIINLICENLLFCKRAISYDSIWFYNVNSANMIAFIVLRYILFRKVFVLMADFRPGKKFSVKYFIKGLINHSKGIISLSSRSIFSNKNFICIPGIVPEHKIKKDTPKVGEKKFLLSGVLKKETGLELAISVFKELPHLELIITGVMNDRYLEEIRDISNINYLGYLDYSDYITLLDRIDFGLSFRDPNHPMNKNNFPSKILEYFSIGKIVISTIDYPEISEMKYFKFKYDCKTLVNAINDINLMPDMELMKYMSNTEYLLNNLSGKAWIKAIEEVEQNI